MNAPESTRQTEFVFRRLGESFPQFMADLWHAVPLWLLILAVAAVAAKVGYTRYVHGGARPTKPDATEGWLWWAAFAAVATLVVWVLVAFFHRDAEQVKSAGTPISALGASNDAMWYAFVGGLFALGCLFVILMYIKDSKSVRWYWAVGLATLRIAVYAILCFVFLLPARQTWDRTEKRSRVVVLLDISPSVTQVTDEIDSRGRKAKTRMDHLIEFLTDDNVKFVQKILEKNPVVVYPFGTRLDETPQVIGRDEKPWGKAEWEAFAAYDFRPFLLKGLSEPGQEALRNSTKVDWNGPKVPQGRAKPDAGNWADVKVYGVKVEKK